MRRRPRSPKRPGSKARPPVSCRQRSGVPPDRILRELETRRGVLGDFELNTAFRFGGVPYDIAERGLKLFAKEVLPVLQSWRAEDTARAAE
jgi:hypothetical protein